MVICYNGLALSLKVKCERSISFLFHALFGRPIKCGHLSKSGAVYLVPLKVKTTDFSRSALAMMLKV